MASEETPLLNGQPPNTILGKGRDVYERFTNTNKRIHVFLVSCCGLLAFFVSGTLLPAIPQIARDLNSTGPIVGLAVSISILAASVGGLCAASYSTFYGRRPVYLAALPLLCVGSMGVAMATSIRELMFWRFIQAFGASPGLTVGAGVVGDLYKLEERGTAMGIFFGACLMGPALAPVIGGCVARYVSWRAMQLVLGVIGAAIFFTIMLFFSETSHPGCRGVDKLRMQEQVRWTAYVVNPVRPLAFLRSPNLLVVAFAGYTALVTNFALLVPLPYTIGARYHITNELWLGACFIPAGIGNMIGAPLAGRLSDKVVVEWRKRRGAWYPEDRLRASLPGGLVLVPLSIILSGLITQYVGGRIGLVLNLICFFANGVGVDIVLSPSSAYNVDVVRSRGAEVIAANSGFRAFLLSFTVAMILPLINKYGVAMPNTVFGVMAWVGTGLLALTIRYGEEMRGWKDVGYCRDLDD